MPSVLNAGHLLFPYSFGSNYWQAKVIDRCPDAPTALYASTLKVTVAPTGTFVTSW